MHDDTTPTPSGPFDGATHHHTPAADRVARDLCMSVFDRWRCGLDGGHDGLHTAHDDDGTTSWNDAVAGRMLREL